MEQPAIIAQPMGPTLPPAAGTPSLEVVAPGARRAGIFRHAVIVTFLALIISPITYRLCLTVIASVKNMAHGREFLINKGIALSPVAFFTQISELPDVEAMVIDSSDFITVIPDNIGDITTLNTFYISNNPIRRLPDTIGDLTSLRYLTIQNTHLTTLPISLGNNQNLTDLSLQGNRLSELPDIFNSLQKLQVLNLAHNNLTSLPPSISNLSQLALLDLTGNKLTKVPDNLPPNLEILFLGGNPIPTNVLVNAQRKYALTHLIIFY